MSTMVKKSQLYSVISTMFSIGSSISDYFILVGYMEYVAQIKFWPGLLVIFQGSDNE